MRVRHIGMNLSSWAMAALLAWTGSTSFAQEPGAADGVAFLKQRVFRIPIEVASPQNESIKELRLFVSTDQGATWTRVASVAPTQRSFTFRSRADGEYWFGLAYVDQAGRVEPEDMRSQKAALKVIVDTQQPILQMRPAMREQDRAGVEWRILDDQPIELGSFRVEYRDKRDGRWQDLNAEGMLEGKVDWSASADQSFIVRATIEDRAGNVGSAEIEIPGVSSGPSSGAPPVPHAPETADTGSRDFVVPPAPPLGPMTPEPSLPTHIPAQAPGAALVERTAVPSAPMPTAPVPAAATVSPPETYTVSKPTAPAATQPTDQYTTSVPSMVPPASPSPASNGVMVGGPMPAVRETVASTSMPARPAPHVVKKAAEPPAAKIPIIASTHFAVDYALRGVGPAGVGRVELYYTKDNGVQWQLLGEDPDRTPPFEVELPGEGRYGLAVVVLSPAGNGQKPPQAGDPPSIQVEVDTTAPEAELYRPVADPQASGEAMLISWSSRDSHLSDRPVRLYYSAQAEGPWEPISTDLPATGQYRWFVPPRTPFQVYLRLSVTDLCNNESVAVTPEPVLVDLSKPEAEVIGIAILPEGGTTR